MKNFNWTSFTKRITVKSSMENIYNAWTKTADIEKWFLSKAVYYDDTKKLIDKNTNLEKGATYEWSWYLYDMLEKGIIIEANGKDYLQFTFAGNCLVEVRLSALDEYIVVELTQKNIPTDDASKESIRLGCDSGWSFFLVNLKSVYESGHDLRNKDHKLKGMVNN
jgi:hypothetical protein